MSNILVLGATSAIAKHTMRLFAADEHSLYLVARNESKLSSMKQDMLVRGSTDVHYEIEISKLKNWMETKSCVMEVTLGSGVIETLPPMKHVTIIFVRTDSTFTKSYDIILDSNLDVRFH